MRKHIYWHSLILLIMGCIDCIIPRPSPPTMLDFDDFIAEWSGNHIYYLRKNTATGYSLLAYDITRNNQTDIGQLSMDNLVISMCFNSSESLFYLAVKALSFREKKELLKDPTMLVDYEAKNEITELVRFNTSSQQCESETLFNFGVERMFLSQKESSIIINAINDTIVDYKLHYFMRYYPVPSVYEYNIKNRQLSLIALNAWALGHLPDSTLLVCQFMTDRIGLFYQGLDGELHYYQDFEINIVPSEFVLCSMPILNYATKVMLYDSKLNSMVVYDLRNKNASKRKAKSPHFVIEPGAKRIAYLFKSSNDRFTIKLDSF